MPHEEDLTVSLQPLIAEPAPATEANNGALPTIITEAELELGKDQ